jgi:hypothetical protein
MVLDVESKWPDPKDGASSEVSEEGSASTQHSSSVATVPLGKVGGVGWGGVGCERVFLWVKGWGFDRPCLDRSVVFMVAGGRVRRAAILTCPRSIDVPMPPCPFPGGRRGLAEVALLSSRVDACKQTTLHTHTHTHTHYTPPTAPPPPTGGGGVGARAE